MTRFSSLALGGRYAMTHRHFRPFSTFHCLHYKIRFRLLRIYMTIYRLQLSAAKLRFAAYALACHDLFHAFAGRRYSPSN